MADKTPSPNQPATIAQLVADPNRHRLSAVVPTLPVLKKEEIDFPFDITDFGTFNGRFGPSNRITCVNCNTGEKFLVLLSQNDVRKDRIRMMQAVTEQGGKIGPLAFRKLDLASGNFTWELADYETGEASDSD